MKVTVKQAASLIGASDDFVRIAMQQNRLPIGSAVKMSNRWAYNIQPGLLADYLSITRKELEWLIQKL